MPVLKAFDIAREALRVGKELMREGDRLSRLEMREARRERILMFARLCNQGVLKRKDVTGDLLRNSPQMKLEIVCRLVVARTPGTQFAAHGAEALDEHALKEGMDVLVRVRWRDRSGGVVVANGRQRIADPVALVLGENSSTDQFARVSDGGAQVFGNKPKVILWGA